MKESIAEVFMDAQQEIEILTGVRGAILHVEISEQGWRKLMGENLDLLFGIKTKEEMPNAYSIGGMIIFREREKIKEKLAERMKTN